MPQKGHRNSKATTAAAGPTLPQQGHGGKKNERPIVHGRPLGFVSKTVGWGGMGLVLVLLLSGVISEELGLNVTRNRLIVSELHLEGSSA